ncbi:MAG: NADH:ubiquinone oxidoreductase [Deltaproteobacteria bacterium]|nr:NADH:ubiquinone oxidoreductase [Deltaproteobacteria bacterium]
MRDFERPKAAFFSFTSCEGCQLAILSCEEALPEILKRIEVVNFREAMSERSDDYKIAFIEGSVSTEEEIARVTKIRERADFVVALGACATTGGLNCLKNRFPMDDVKRIVYGKDAGQIETVPARPIDSVIKVDYRLHGCPISGKEFLAFFADLVMGRSPRTPNYPVCVDCKMAGNICVFEKGMYCVGPVTRAGCDAICVTYGSVCWGCRGYVDDPNVNAHRETLKRYGLTAKGVAQKLDLYGGKKQ